MPPCMGEASDRATCPFSALAGHGPLALAWPPGSGSRREGRVGAESHIGQRIGCLDTMGVSERSPLPREDEIFPAMWAATILGDRDLH